MPTSPRPVSSRAHRPTLTGAATRTATMRSMAQRLRVSESSLRAYLDANGGAPDGGDHGHDRAAEVIDQHPGSHAPPESAAQRQPLAPWVKRDRPRYFIPG